MKRKKTMLLVLILFSFLVSCGDSDDSAGGSGATTPTATTVNITLVSFSISSDKTTFAVGTPYSFVITNNANITHEWMIMPRGSTNEAEALVIAEDIAPGTNVTVNFTFAQAGDYEFACHLANHYQLGMKMDITVQ
jgi:uncharacterized cupredoxin-like copper-binding protein